MSISRAKRLNTGLYNNLHCGDEQNLYSPSGKRTETKETMQNVKLLQQWRLRRTVHNKNVPHASVYSLPLKGLEDILGR